MERLVGVGAFAIFLLSVGCGGGDPSTLATSTAKVVVDPIFDDFESGIDYSVWADDFDPSAAGIWEAKNGDACATGTATLVYTAAEFSDTDDLQANAVISSSYLSGALEDGQQGLLGITPAWYWDESTLTTEGYAALIVVTQMGTDKVYTALLYQWAFSNGSEFPGFPVYSNGVVLSGLPASFGIKVLQNEILLYVDGVLVETVARVLLPVAYTTGRVTFGQTGYGGTVGESCFESVGYQASEPDSTSICQERFAELREQRRLGSLTGREFGQAIAAAARSGCGTNSGR